MKRMIFLLGFLLTGCASVSNPNENLVLAAKDNVTLGLSYLSQGDTPQAKEKLLLALSQAPELSVTQDAMGYFLEKTGDNSKAEPYYQKALKLNPDDGAALTNYGDFLCREGQSQQAIALFLKAAENTNYINSAFAYENAGLCALTIPDEKVAKTYFIKALQQDPDLELSKRELERIHA